MKRLLTIILFFCSLVSSNAEDLSININGTDTVKELISYGNGQDIGGVVTTADANKTLNMTGNTWKAIDLTNLDITPGTILEFDFSSSSEGEIHGIGFDTDLNIDPAKTFKLFGTQGWGNTDFETYFAHSPDVKTYRIPVGSYYTGNQKYLFFALDHDVETPTAQMTVSNIKIYKNNFSVNINGTDTVKELISYGNGQDIDGVITISDANKTLNMTGNTWKAIDLTSLNISPGTILEFDFSSSSEGEIHGIGFDSDLNIDASKTLKLYGTQDFGINNFESYSSTAPNVKTYRIPVGSFYTGDYKYLFFALDHDEVTPTAQMTISNVKIYKNTLNVNLNGTDLEKDLMSYGLSQDMESTIVTSNGNKTLNMTGNTWKAIDLSSIDITPGSTLQFSFSSSKEGEIHGIGFDTDLNIDPAKTFKLYGTQVWGINNFNNYSTSAPGVVSYNIPIGQHYTGIHRYLFIALDHDIIDPDAQSTISNIVITTPVTYTVTFAAGPNGSLTGDLNQVINEGGSTTSVTAIPANGYVFDKWSDENTSNPRTIDNVTENLSLTALFKLEVTTPPVAGTIFSQDFTFDDLNRRDTVVLNSGWVWDYDYDGKGNLEKAHKAHPSDPEQDLLFNYTYDGIGNRATSNEKGVNKTYAANDIQQYTSVNEDGTVTNLTYDDAGNPDDFKDWDLTWDGEDRLKTMTNSITGIKLEFGYDYRGFRGWKKVFDAGDYDNPAEWIGYVYDGNLVSEEIDLLNNKKIIRSYTWGLDPAGTQQQIGGIGALVSMEETQPDDSYKTYHYITDAGGNVTNLVESKADGSLAMADTIEYGPFGQVVASNVTTGNPYKFNTKFTDSETDLVYYGFRFYNPEDGRWLNRDPIGVNGGINIYNSVSNNMVNGFSGGWSITGGMVNNSGRLSTSTGIDTRGKDILVLSPSLSRAFNTGGNRSSANTVYFHYESVSKAQTQRFKINNFDKKYTGDVTFTYRTRLIDDYGNGGLDLEGGFKFDRGGTPRGEFNCDEIRWIQVFHTNYWHNGVKYGFGNYTSLDPALDLQLDDVVPGMDEVNRMSIGYDNLPFYFGGTKSSLTKSHGYDLYFQDSPGRNWDLLTPSSPFIRWEAELCMVAWNKKTGSIDPIRCFKYGFRLFADFDVENGKFFVKKNIVQLNPSKVIDLGPKPSQRFLKALDKSGLVE